MWYSNSCERRAIEWSMSPAVTDSSPHRKSTSARSASATRAVADTPAAAKAASAPETSASSARKSPVAPKKVRGL